MPTTTNGAPYPAPTDPNNVPADLQALAEWADDAIAGASSFTSGLLSARPAASNSGDSYFATDVQGGTLYLDNGSWKPAVSTLLDNSETSTHGFAPSSLRYSRAAIAACRAGIRDFRMGCQGDSIAAGAGVTDQFKNPYWARAAKILAARTGLKARMGLVPLAINSVQSAQWTIGSGWSVSLEGLGEGIKFYTAAAGGTGVLDFAPTDDEGVAVQTDSFVIYAYAGGSAGSFQWSIDGGSYTTQATTGSLGCHAYTVSAGTRGAHTLHIKPPASGNQPFILGAEAVDSQNRGIRYIGGGKSGTVTPSAPADQGFTDVWNAFAPDMLIYGWGTNDYGFQTALATFKANVQAMAAAAPALTKPCDALWASFPPQSDTTKTIPMASYYATLDAAGEAGSFPVLHVDRTIGTYAIGNASPLSLYADAIHPNDAGHNYWGATLATLLGLL